MGEISKANDVIQKKKLSISEEQRTIAKSAREEIRSGQSEIRSEIQSKLDTAASEVEAEFKKADSASEQIKKDAEKSAAKEKKRILTDDAWWDWAKNSKNVVAEAAKRFDDFLNKIYKDAQHRINALIQTTRNKANSIILKAVSSISTRLNRFQSSLEKLLNGLITEKYPALAR